MSDHAVRFINVGKRFRRGESHDSLRDMLSNGITRLWKGRVRTDSNTFWGLREVSFAVNRGEAIGVIGPNGAGKSTALKLLSGVLRPDEGSVIVRGRLAALIEVGAGFHGDLTGRENIFLNGAILGMTRAEIRRKLDAIVAFAGLEAFLDMPVKRYSSGMYARLGFSIAAHVDPDILLVDEVLSVGDAVFRLRCLDRMRQLVRGGTTLVFVTHDLDQVQSICGRAIVLSEGRVAFDGLAKEAVGQYMQTLSRTYASRRGDLAGCGNGEGSAIEQVELRIFDERGREAVWTRPDDESRVVVSFQTHRDVARLVVEVNLRAGVGSNLISVNSARDDRCFRITAGTHEIALVLPALPIAGGAYLWNVRMWDAQDGAMLIDTPFQFPVVVNDGGRATGALCLEHWWCHRDLTATDPSDRGDPFAPTAHPGLVEVGA